MTNTAKHFICYSLLILAFLFTFMLFRKAELDRSVTQQQLADRNAAVQKIKQNATTEIAQRDAQLAKADALLDREQRNAQNLDQQVALINQLVQLPHQIKTEVVQANNPSKLETATPNPEGLEPGVVIQASDVPEFMMKEVACKKCQNDVIAAKADLLTTQTVVQQQEGLLKDYKNEVARQPHTRWQRFHTGLKWVFSLGASKH